MNTKTTKEELLINADRAGVEIDRLNDREKRTREEFAKVFNWYGKTDMYTREQKLSNPSWEEIFTEIGKLLASQKALYYITDVEQMKIHIQEIQIELKNIKQEKLN